MFNGIKSAGLFLQHFRHHKGLKKPPELFGSLLLRGMISFFAFENKFALFIYLFCDHVCLFSNEIIFQ